MKPGQYADALTDFNTSIGLEPDFALAYDNRGAVKGLLGQYDDALKDHNIAIGIEPNSADAYYNRGEIKIKLYQYADALTDFNTAIKLNPDHARAYHNRGLTKALLRLRQTGKVKQDFQTALQDFQTALKLAKQRGDVELKNHIEETLRLLQKNGIE